MILAFTVVNRRGPVYNVHSDALTSSHNLGRPIPLQIKLGTGRESLLELFKIRGFMMKQASLTKKNSKQFINTRMGLDPDRTSREETGHVP